LESLESLYQFLIGLADKSVDIGISKDERKTIRSEIPEGLNNVRQLLKSFKRYLDAAKEGVPVDEDPDDLSWSSDISEMEFLDSDEELDAFKPQEDIFLQSSDDDNDFEDTPKRTPKKKIIQKVNKIKLKVHFFNVVGLE
jgi:hypothetical protein